MNNPRRLLHLEWAPFAELDRDVDAVEALRELRAVERNCTRLENELARVREERDAALSRLRQLLRKFEEEG